MEAGRRLDALISGVGGQGIITLATVLAEAAVMGGYNAIVAETHGMSQRGGTVVVHLRIGDVEAPLVMEGGGSLLISMEPLEALRYARHLRRGGVVVTDTRVIRPPFADIEVPALKEIIGSLEEAGLTVYPVDAVGEAQAQGDARAANMYLAGYGLAVHGYEGLVTLEGLKEAIKNTLRNPDLNIRVMVKGYSDGLNARGGRG